MAAVREIELEKSFYAWHMVNADWVAQLVIPVATGNGQRATCNLLQLIIR